ncbi:MAG: hypothetical protein JO131_07115 [Gammaproteobacteria bacterium]|nr:hypothetical protein [Gammaproteobacteria bacterium]
MDPRTKKSHELKYNKSYTNNNYGNNYQEPEEGNNLMEYEPVPEINIPLSNFTGQSPEVIEPLSERTYSFLTKKVPIHESEKYQKIKKGKISDLVLENLLPDNERNKDDNRNKGFDDSDGDGDSESFEDEDNDSEDSEDSEVDDDGEANFASTDFEDGEPNLPNINVDDNYTWVILWILRYQQRYKLPNVAIDSLFKFLKAFLSMIDKNKFSSFPSSLHTAKKSLGISANIIKYAACNQCHKLYDISELSNKTEILTCSFIDYPNHSQERFRQKCNNPLVKKVDSNSGNPIFRPIMTFPIVNIKQQLTLFFGRKNFEVACRKWAERRNDTEVLFDIYDGKIWKSFEDENGEPFFTYEYADTHIGLILNMDWFQPFVNSQYSVGVIYAVICNLPRNERFKPYNTLTLAIIPGPKEPKLHGINNYLYPIINQLNRLWEGYHIKTYEHNNGRFVRGAIIGCSCDVPASRKLCGFISARIACYRCYKSANLINKQPNFGGFEDFDDWFVERDINVIREKAREWKECATEESRKAHVSQHHVRWSEIYRLPYFNPVRLCVVDPMHCLFLGVAKWIVMKLWIGEGVLNDEKLRVMQERADMIEFTSELGRRPVRIATGEGFSNFTADMWKTFILNFATPITWSFLGETDRKILAYFVRACKILTCRELQKSELNEAFTKLVEINKLIEQKYGQNKISPNLHLCLHICECALDYGPLSSFWCFSFERMNGILGMYIDLPI